MACGAQDVVEGTREELGPAVIVAVDDADAVDNKALQGGEGEGDLHGGWGEKSRVRRE